MTGAARAAVLALGALLALAGGLACAAGGGGFGLIAIGLIIILSVLAERRYRHPRTDTAPKGPDWSETGEAFADEEHGGWIKVWYNARTGERRYLPTNRPDTNSRDGQKG